MSTSATATQLIRLGALVQFEGVLFRLWAPHAHHVELIIDEQSIPMPSLGNGIFEYFAEGMKTDTLYWYKIDGGPLFPDPASRFQPRGVHGPSQVVDPLAFAWTDNNWNGITQESLVFYEIHIGTFTSAGTYAGVQERLPYLKELGVTALQIMPLADFPGERNWGYDPAALYAPARCYGTPNDLRSLVDAAHQQGLAVFLDVIYNHLGPDGAYVAAVAPFYTDKHHTPWGSGINFDDAECAGVRNFLLENALYWLKEFHFDGLRLDATDTIKDDSDVHFLAELATLVAELPGRKRYLFAEDSRNIRRLISPVDEGGLGMDGVWADDYHHQMRNLTAGDTHHYYFNYANTTASDLAKTIRGGWYFQGQVYPGNGRPRGTDPTGLNAHQFVFCIQNHDQVGNRLNGARLNHEVELNRYRMASAVLLFLPQLPLVFMGQEWAASAPFQFFSDHEEQLGKLVSAGRKKDFAHDGIDPDSVPDPQDNETFLRSRLDWAEAKNCPHSSMLKLYRVLLDSRTSLHGELDVLIHDDYAITLRRGRHMLLVALRDDQRLPFPNGAKLIWDTEQASFADDGNSPRQSGNELYFAHVAAAMFEITDM